MKHAHAKTGEEGAQLCTPECKTKSHLYSLAAASVSLLSHTGIY